jgi:hypothetical protein
MNKVFPVEIRNFRSLGDIGTYVDKGIMWYKEFLKEYNESLGALLREQGSNPEELEKKLREKGLARQSSGKKGGKKKGAPTSNEWFNYKGLMFSAEKQCKAEIYFEAVDKFKNSLERLKETKNLLEEVQKTGLGIDTVYLAYIVEGVPEKIIIEPAGKIPKFELKMSLSTSMKSIAPMQEALKQQEATPKEAEKPDEEKSDVNKTALASSQQEQPKPESKQEAPDSSEV